MGAFENSRLYRPNRGRGARGGSSAHLAAVLAGVAAALLIVSRVDPNAVAPARGWIADLAAPVVTAAAASLAPVSRALGTWRQPAPSSAEAARLASLEMRLQDLELENAGLKRLARYVRNAKPDLLAVRVLMSSASPLSQTVLVNAGRNQGVKGGFPVVSGDGLIGRIVQSYADQASVMLLTDRLSRVPVAIGTGQARAVLAGTGGPFPKLDFLPAGAAIAAGDHVTTSGIGGVFPRGLAIGVVAGDATGWRVELTGGRAGLMAAGILFFEAGVFEQTESSAGKTERPSRQAAVPSANPEPGK